MKSIPSVAALLVLAVAFTGCRPKNDPKPTVDAENAASVTAFNEAVHGAPSKAFKPGTIVPKDERVSAAATSLPVMGPAPDWTLKDLQGNAVSSDNLKGKVTVVDFWATWCPPCRAEIPGYVELTEKYGKDKLVIVGVSLDQAGPQVVKDFAERFKINYPVVMGDDKVVAAFGGVEAIPTTFLIDQKGQLRDKKVGAEEKESYEKKIAALLAEG